MVKYVMSEQVKSVYAELQAEVEKCEKLRLEGKAYAGKDEQLDTCKAKARELNKAMAAEIIAAYAKQAETDAEGVVRDYLDNWFFDGFKVSQHDAENGGDVFIDETRVRIPFSAIDTASKTKLTTNGAWRKYLLIFADNCVRFNSANEKGVDNKKEKAIHTKTALPTELIEKRAKLGWDVEPSKNNLHTQLNELVAMILPESMHTFMLKSDVRAFITAMANLKRADSMANSNLNFAVAKEKALEELLFRTIYTRRNNLATNYEFAYKSKSENKNAELNEKPAQGGVVSGETKVVSKEEPAA